jgi:hypothetical protein
VRNANARWLAKTDAGIRKAARDSMQAGVEVIALQLTEVVRRWSDKPSFVGKSSLSRTTLRAFVEVKGTPDARKHFLWTDEGTKPHIIRPRNASALAFSVGYNAVTRPVAQFNVGTGQSTGPRVFAQEVNHPGTEAREFSAEYLRQVWPEIVKDWRDNIRKLNA